MKFRVSMKCPDALDEAINDVVNKDVVALPISPKEQLLIAESRSEELREFCIANWFRHGEYLDVEIDTDAGTCTVLPEP